MAVLHLVPPHDVLAAEERGARRCRRDAPARPVGSSCPCASSWPAARGTSQTCRGAVGARDRRDAGPEAVPGRRPLLPGPADRRWRPRLAGHRVRRRAVPRAAHAWRTITSPQAMKELGVRCRGLQPWQYPRRPSAEHDEVPMLCSVAPATSTLRRRESALDIPPESDYSDSSEAVISVTTHKFWPDGDLPHRTDPWSTASSRSIAAETRVSEAPDPADPRPGDWRCEPGGCLTAMRRRPARRRVRWLSSPLTTRPTSRSTFVTRRVDLSSEGMGDRQAAVDREPRRACSTTSSSQRSCARYAR